MSSAKDADLRLVTVTATSDSRQVVGFLKPGPRLDRPRRRSVTTVDLRQQLATPY
jgi:hypothetical protein